MALNMTSIGWNSNIDPTVIDGNFKKISKAFDNLIASTNGFIGTYVYEGDKIQITLKPGNNQIRLTNPKKNPDGAAYNTAQGSSPSSDSTTIILDDNPGMEFLDIPAGYKAMLITAYLQKSTLHNIYVQCLGINYVNIYNAENSNITCTLTPRWLVYKAIKTSTPMLESDSISDLQANIEMTEGIYNVYTRADE